MLHCPLKDAVERNETRKDRFNRNFVEQDENAKGTLRGQSDSQGNELQEDETHNPKGDRFNRTTIKQDKKDGKYGMVPLDSSSVQFSKTHIVPPKMLAKFDITYRDTYVKQMAPHLSSTGEFIVYTRTLQTAASKESRFLSLKPIHLQSDERLRTDFSFMGIDCIEFLLCMKSIILNKRSSG